MKRLGSAYRRLKKFYRQIRTVKFRLHQELFYRYDLSLKLFDEGLRLPYSIKLLEESEVHVLHQIWPVNLEVVRERLRKQHSVCYLTVDGEKAVAYHWAQLKGKHFIQPIGKTIRIEENDFFVIYHTRVHLDYQSQGINRYVIQQMLSDLQRKGYSLGLIYTSAKNKANQNSLEKLGFKKYLDFRSLQVGKSFWPLEKKKII